MNDDARSATWFLRTAVAIDLSLIALGVVLGLGREDPSRYFNEAKFLTYLSCGQLFATGVMSGLVFRWRRRATGEPRTYLWLLVATGFVFLAIDDAFEIHEQLDLLIHRGLDLRESAISDRLDDGLILAYGAVGVSVLFFFRKELVLHREMLPYLAAGLVLSVVTVFFDALGNRPDVMSLVDSASAEALVNWVDVLEGSSQLLAEATFLTAFYAAARGARERDGNESMTAAPERYSLS